MLAGVRNCIAHYSGCLDAMPAGKAAKIRKWTTSSPGLLRIFEDWLIVEPAFARDQFDHTNALLEDMMRRIEASRL